MELSPDLTKLPNMPKLITSDNDFFDFSSSEDPVSVDADPIMHSLYPVKRPDVKEFLNHGLAFVSAKLKSNYR